MTIPNTIEPIAIPGSRVAVSFGSGNLAHLGRIARERGASRVLVVSDAGIVAAGHAERAVRSLRDAGLEAALFGGAAENPTTEHVAAGVAFAAPLRIDWIVGLGGGSAMDCAKGISFILTNGGRMQDYWKAGGGHAPAKPLLPLMVVPTTAGTGSDAQSYALITDPATHQKMACGDAGALPRVAILDPELTATQPRSVAAATGIDAIAHAVETSGCNRRNEVSRRLSREAWACLSPVYETAVRQPTDIHAREQMLWGAHLAGAAIENSMLGAAHSLANALTAVCGTVHGVAVGMMLPHVVRFNAAGGSNPYEDIDGDAARLAGRLEALLAAASLPRRLSEAGIAADLIPRLGAIAAKQWTASFNPRPVGEAEFREILFNAL